MKNRLTKNIVRVIVVIITSVLTVYFTGINGGYTHSAGGSQITGYSGSPYDRGKTCAASGCHNTYAIKQAPASWLSSNIPASGYVPGATYTITCKAVNTSLSENENFGFEFTPQNQTTGNVEGTLANITTSGTGSTQITTSGNSQYVTHTSSSYNALDSTSWSFKWTAPYPGIGAVNVYVTYNCGAFDIAGSGQIYWDSTHFNQSSAAAVNEISTNAKVLQVYPNPIYNSECTLGYELQDAENISVQLLSLEGKMVKEVITTTKQSAGQHYQSIQLQDVAAGVYFLELTTENSSVFKRIVIQ